MPFILVLIEFWIQPEDWYTKSETKDILTQSKILAKQNVAIGIKKMCQATKKKLVDLTLPSPSIALNFVQPNLGLTYTTLAFNLFLMPDCAHQIHFKP